MGKKDKTVTPVVVTSCPGCKKRCCESLSVMQQALEKERKKNKKLAKQLKAQKPKKAKKKA